MRKIRIRKLNRETKMTDKGFSLIEVLVCIALLAIVCIPLFSGFRLSARLNNKAHHTQKVTAYAQEELETIKMLSVADYVKQVEADGGSKITSGTEWDEMNDRASGIAAKFNPGVTLTEEEKKELFQPFILEKKNVPVGGKNYTLHVKFMPAEYSQYEDKISAAGVNVAGYFDVAAADAARFPVISNEINLYDTACTDVLLDKLKGVGIAGKTDADVLANLQKKVEVTAAENGDTLEVRCEVTYSYPAESPSVEASYLVYKGSYEIDPVADADGLKRGEESGGSIFLLASAFQSAWSGTSSIHNILEITSTGDSDIYFVLNRTEDENKLYNFEEITVNGTPYLTGYDMKAAVPGEMQVLGTNGTFKTNIKSNGMEVIDTEKSESIGAESYKTITYAVEIEMYDETDGDKKVADIEATKVDR